MSCNSTCSLSRGVDVGHAGGDVAVASTVAVEDLLASLPPPAFS